MKDWDEFKEEIKEISNHDAEVLVEKGKSYGNSWKARGGVGAFFVTIRKYDRLENVAKKYGYDIFEALLATYLTPDGLLDDLADLRRYLLLIEHEVNKLAIERKLVEKRYENK